MTTAQSNQTFVEVIETQRVKYKPHQFLFFSWLEKISAIKLRRDIEIMTNDDIENVYFNGKLLSNPEKTK